MTTTTNHLDATIRTPSLDDDPAGADDFLEARPDRAGHAGTSTHPILVAALTGLAGALVIGAIVIGLGLLLTHVLASGAIGTWDDSVGRWFVAHRTPTLDTWSEAGSRLGETVTVVGMTILTTVVCAVKRWWRELGVLLIGLAVECSVFLTATILVERARPSVVRLDVSPPTSSYPSGHTAAAIVLYGALAIIASVHVRNAAVRAFVWILAVLLPVAVGVSRIYRGMHHATDVLASVLLGIAALTFAVLAVRAADAAAERRAAQASRSGIPS
jgi:membrane-associated phospholipid phosphatase